MADSCCCRRLLFLPYSLPKQKFQKETSPPPVPQTQTSYRQWTLTLRSTPAGSRVKLLRHFVSFAINVVLSSFSLKDILRGEEGGGEGEALAGVLPHTMCLCELKMRSYSSVVRISFANVAAATRFYRFVGRYAPIQRR